MRNSLTALSVLCSVAATSLAGAQGLAQERRNLNVVQSIYNTGKYGATLWGSRQAVAKCRKTEDPEATVENFKQSIRDAYGKAYEKYKEVIEKHLSDPETETRFAQGHASASTRLLSSNCSDLVLGQIVKEIETGLDNQISSMRRMASTL